MWRKKKGVHRLSSSSCPSSWFATLDAVFRVVSFVTLVLGYFSVMTSTFSRLPPETTPAVVSMQTHVCVSPRIPRFLQFLHRWGVSSGPRAARDGAELRFCFWHGGQEANEEVVGYTDYELHEPTGGWDPVLWPAHLHQAPRPWKWAVLRPRALQCHG